MELKSVASILNRPYTAPSESVVAYFIRRSSGKHSVSLNKLAYVLSTFDTFLGCSSFEEEEEGEEETTNHEVEKNEKVGRVWRIDVD